MARPEIKSLKYFPLDVGIFEDKKIRLLRGQHGADGVEIYIRLIRQCYRENGYYLIWEPNEDYALLADDTGYSEDKVRLIVSSCVERSLFNDTLFRMGNVLTSRGIQRRYFEAISKSKIKAAAQGRHTTIPKDICLLTDEDFSEINKTVVWLKFADHNLFSENNLSKSGNNHSKSGNNTVKERKGNKNNTSCRNSSDAEIDDVRTEFEKNAFLAAEYIAKQIRKHTPNHPQVREEIKDKSILSWSKDIEKLLRIDKVDFDDFKRVLRYSQTDPFWQKNIMSGRKLREQYGQLLAKLPPEDDNE